MRAYRSLRVTDGASRLLASALWDHASSCIDVIEHAEALRCEQAASDGNLLASVLRSAVPLGGLDVVGLSHAIGLEGSELEPLLFCFLRPRLWTTNNFQTLLLQSRQRLYCALDDQCVSKCKCT